MQTIVTKYLGPTDHRDSRIKTQSYQGTKTYPYNREVSDPHAYAAQQHLSELFCHDYGDWEIKNSGELPCGTGHVYIVGYQLGGK